jgi:hypothetical protein
MQVTYLSGAEEVFPVYRLLPDYLLCILSTKLLYFASVHRWNDARIQQEIALKHVKTPKVA